MREDQTVTTLIELFRHAVARDKRDLLNHKVGREWQSISAQELARQVRAVAMGLYALGVRGGEHVGLLSENRVEWTMVDLGVLAAGAADVPIYPTQAPKQVAYILNDAEVEILFLSNQAQYDRVREALLECPKLRVIVSFDPVSAPRGRVMSFADFMQWGRAADEAEPELYDTLARAVTSENLATLIYTSGTTGEPKGVMLTHGNLTANALANYAVAQLQPDFTTLTFLPFSHILERTTIYMYLYAGVSIFYAQSIETVAEDLLAARPHFMTSVPRLYEKIYARAMERAEAKGEMTVTLARWALGVAKQCAEIEDKGEQPGALLKLKRAVADKLVFTKWRAGMGGRVRTLVSGGAPLADELAKIFWGVGLPIYQGYGLTESSPTITVNRPGANRIGSVGQAVPGVSVKIADDGEILASGPSVMSGYYNRDEETEATLTTDEDGRVWLRTGDIGKLDKDGFLYITDRKKDLLKTSGGKYVAPQPIENAIKRSRYVNQVVVIGDNRKFPSALIVPQLDALTGFAKARGIATESTAAMLRHPDVIKLMEDEVEEQCADLAQYERVKGVVLLDREMTVEGGELTPTLKVKRRVVVDKHKESIDDLYARKDAQHVPHA